MITPPPSALVFRLTENRVEIPGEIQGTAPNVGDFTGLRGADALAVLARIPAGWIPEPSDAGGGVVFRNPTNPAYDWVRLMPGNLNSRWENTRGPYLRVFRNGTYVDENGQPVSSHDQSGHIPLRDNPALGPS